MNINKAIITAAGFGTRFLPASKGYQKEMVPIMEKPQLQYVVEEAIASGITEIAVVVRKGNDTFRTYLEDDDSLWRLLKETGKEERMESWRIMKTSANFTFIEQNKTDPYGNGTPFILSKGFAGGDPVVGMWGDDIMIHQDKTKPTVIEQISNFYEKHKPTAVMTARKVSRDEISRFGCYEFFDPNNAEIPYQVKKIIEKPTKEEAPSLMANTCRFVLTTEIFEELEKRIPGKDKEVWLTDAIDRLVQNGHKVAAHPITGSETIAVGDPMGWLKANIKIALENEKYAKETRTILHEIQKSIN